MNLKPVFMFTEKGLNKVSLNLASEAKESGLKFWRATLGKTAVQPEGVLVPGVKFQQVPVDIGSQQAIALKRQRHDRVAVQIKNTGDGGEVVFSPQFLQDWVKKFDLKTFNRLRNTPDAVLIQKREWGDLSKMKQDVLETAQTLVKKAEDVYGDAVPETLSKWARKHSDDILFETHSDPNKLDITSIG